VVPTIPNIRRPWSRSERPIPTRIIRPAQQFLHTETSSGIILLIATVIALLWANIDTGSYLAFWSTELTIEVAGWGHTEDLRHVVNDGLMVLFFFVIGLEVKRELKVGELVDRRMAILPMLAALGGMVVPAGIFLLLTLGTGEATRGWGIPMATDIAFALGVLALLGSRVPIALKVLLLGIAVIDDLGAIIVIAIFYSDDIASTWLAAAIAGLVVMRVLGHLQVRARLPYVVLGLGIWLATFESGIHATIAGVAIGLLTPALPFQRSEAVSAAAREIADAASRGDGSDPDHNANEWQTLSMLSREAISPLWQLERALHPWTSSVVLPLFALANVGIVIDATTASTAFEGALGYGIVAGLVIGKPIGILAGAILAVRLGIPLPMGINWRHITGIGFLAGIGFTMSLFVTTLAFRSSDFVEAATFAVLIASVIAGILGAVVLARSGIPAPKVEATLRREAEAALADVER
jgi:Na+:H+ antiporter, NhaA family